jgi:hypothetical protein
LPYQAAVSAQPNIGNLHRLVYVAIGIGLMVWGFFFAEPNGAQVLLPVLGAGTLIEGLVGW